MGLNTPPSQRSPARIVLGGIMILFAVFRLVAMLRALPALFDDLATLISYTIFSLIIVGVFLFVGIRVFRQGLGTQTPQREEEAQ